MDSKIRAHLKMKSEVVAVYQADEAPEGALQPKAGTRACVVAFLNVAAQGRTVAFSAETTGCMGGKSGLGLAPFRLGFIEYFLSTGGKSPRPGVVPEKEGEFYKKTPELAKEYIETLPEYRNEHYVIFEPLSKVPEGKKIQGVIFLVNMDQMSGLATLANYDQHTQNNVEMYFSAGCAQAVLRAFHAENQKAKKCIIGLTDPSARKCIDKDIISFSIPYDRFLEMEAEADGSFFKTETWKQIAERI